MGNRLENNGNYRVSKGIRINRVLGMKSKVKFKIWVVVNNDVNSIMNSKIKENR